MPDDVDTRRAHQRFKELAAPGRGLAVEPADERARPRAEAPPDSVRRFEIAIAAGDAGQARAKVAGDLK